MEKKSTHRKAPPRTAQLGGLSTIAVGLLALAGWVANRPFLASFAENGIPMAPSSALAFIAFGVAILLRTRMPAVRQAYWASTVLVGGSVLVSVVLLASSAFGIYWPIEHLGFNTEGSIYGPALGHMSPITALLFVLSGMSFLILFLRRTTRFRLAIEAYLLACLPIVFCAILLLGYIDKHPFFYGGMINPPAATGLLAFIMLDIALMSLAGAQVWPTDEVLEPAYRFSYRLIMAFVLLAASAVAVGVFYFRQYEVRFRAQVEQQLKTVAELKYDELLQWRKERLGDGASFGMNAAFSDLAKAYFADPREAETRERLQKWLHQSVNAYLYDRLSLFDTQGVERISVPPHENTNELLPPGDVAAILQGRAVVLRDFYRDPLDDRVYLSVMVPIYEGSEGQQPLAILVMRIDPQKYLYPFLRRWPTTSQTAETLLVRREGDDVVFLNDLRFQKNVALGLRASIRETTLPAAKAALGQEGVVEGYDYRGVPVLAAIRAISDSPWRLIARMDMAEVYAPARDRLWEMILVIGALLIGVGAAVGSAWRQQRLRIYQERYRAAEALHESEEKFRGMAEHLQDVLFATNADGVIHYVSPSVHTMMACTPDEMIGHPVVEFLADESVSTVMHALTATLRSRQPAKELRAKARRLDGTVFSCELNVSAVLHGEEAVGLMGLVRDITDRLRAEEERNRLENQLRQAQKMEAVGQLAGGVAHDFNNLLQGILGYTEMVLAGLTPSDKHWADLLEVQKAAERAAQLTRQLLAFSRRQVLEPMPLDLNAVVVELMKLIQRIIGEHIQLDVIPCRALATTLADHGQIEQVLINLCVNARDAMPDGGRLTIETENVVFDAQYCDTHEWAAPGRYVLVSVTDSGYGMDTETMQRIFEPFFTTKEFGKGTGLGLATVYGIVRQHDGMIQVYSEPGKGTKFKIYLPVLERAASIVERGLPDPVFGGHETILLAEDDAQIRRLAKRLLEAAGYMVFDAGDGEDALILYRTCARKIDLLLLDVVMPRKGGRAVFDAIRAEQPDVACLFTSGYSENAVHTDFILEAGLHLLQKPYQRDNLLRAVRKTLDERV